MLAYPGSSLAQSSGKLGTNGYGEAGPLQRPHRAQTRRRDRGLESLAACVVPAGGNKYRLPVSKLPVPCISKAAYVSFKMN